MTYEEAENLSQTLGLLNEQSKILRILEKFGYFACEAYEDGETKCYLHVIKNGEFATVEITEEELETVTKWLEKKRDSFNRTYDNLLWRPINLYFSEKGKHDWALVQFKEKVSGFVGIPHLCEWRESGKFGDGWYTQDGEDDRATFDYLNDSCSAIAFFEWPKCPIDVGEEKK